jgi:pimeloyl-ACP methyl ester carboxylesterase
MATIATKDGTELYYKDSGEGPAVTFSHGWPLDVDIWDGQILFLAQNGFRAIAHDRRGHGRSSQPSAGNDMNGYADDLAAVIEALDLNDVTVVGHSTGGGEVARYIGRDGTSRVSKIVQISAVPPGLLKTDANPEGLPSQAFDGLRAGLVGASIPVLQGPDDAVLRSQPARRQGLAGPPRRVLELEHAVRPEELVRERHVPRRDGLHRRPREVRRADLAAPRRG